MPKKYICRGCERILISSGQFTSIGVNQSYITYQVYSLLFEGLSVEELIECFAAVNMPLCGECGYPINSMSYTETEIDELYLKGEINEETYAECQMNAIASQSIEN